MGKHKPADPLEIIRKRAERAAMDAEITRLRGQGVVVRLDRSRRIVSAYRQSPFVKLRESNTISAGQLIAAEKLAEDWAIWRRLDGGPEKLGIPLHGHEPGQLVTDRMLRAGERVNGVLSRIGPLDRELLSALIGQLVERDQVPPWREIVARITGVTQTVRQSQMIVAALENLSRAYAIH